MVKITGGDKLEARLKEIAANLSKAKSVQIGFMAGATYDDGTPVALVAAVNEWGAPSRGQPPRPFFRNMIADKSGEWPGKLGYFLKANDYDAKAALGAMGEIIREELQTSITELTSPPLKQSTIDRKGSDKPLVQTGHMLASPTYEVQD